MDCLRAQQIFSEAMDSDVPLTELAEARAHCAECEECARFLSASERIGSLPMPKAPAALVEQLIALGAEEAATLRATAEAQSEQPVADLTELVPTEPARRILPAWWAPRLTAYAAIAAVLLVALVATGIGLGNLLSPESAELLSTDTRTDSYGNGGATAVPPTSSDQSTGATKSAEASAPPYVAIDGLVYVPTGPRTVDASSLVTATPVVSALDTGGDPVSIPAYTITGSPGVAVLRMTDGTYLGFSEVTRTFGGKPFVLTSGTAITAYGFWPTLPTRFPAPTAADGSPTFSFFGKDDSGVLIYVPAGGQPTTGFAVAPGTSASDPAAGNPNWTWWQAR